MHILFVSSEVVPFAKTGGLADVIGILPQALAKLNCKTSIILPFHRAVRKNGFKPSLLKTDVKIDIGKKTDTFNLYYIKHNAVNVYFVEKDEYFDRDYLYGTQHGDYPDNAIRYGFFAKAVLSSIPHLEKVDILHLNDWQSALTSLYLKLYYAKENAFKDIKTLFTIHNLAYQGLFEKEVMSSLSLPEELYNINALEFYGKVSFMKAGIIYSDAISTVSKGYAREILTPDFGCGLDGLLRTRKKDLYGILNGIDYSVWNPATDKFIYKNYDSKNMAPKLECKKALFKELGLKYDESKPLIGVITRLAEQKGVDLIAHAMDDILSLGTDFVLLGTGDVKYNNLFKEIEKSYKDKVSINIIFDEVLAHKIEAASDFFLMPSRYEPCGLNQMYSLKYATVPIVRAVGGLDDTITEFNPQTGKGNGFRFSDASTQALVITLKKAMRIYKDKKLWNTLLKNCLACDFSWDSSAEQYNQLYNKLLSN